MLSYNKKRHKSIANIGIKPKTPTSSGFPSRCLRYRPIMDTDNFAIVGATQHKLTMNMDTATVVKECPSRYHFSNKIA